MPPMRRKRKVAGKRPRRRPQSTGELSTSAQRYNGPVVSRVFNFGDHTTTLLLVFQTTLASDGAGVIASVFSNNPSSAANWADTNTVWGEYRCLGFRVEFFPYNRYSKTTTTCVPLVVDVDRRSATALASYAAATSRETAKMRSVEDPWFEQATMNGSEESQFLAVSSTTPFIWIKTFGSGYTISTTYGMIIVKYRIQFRNVE